METEDNLDGPRFIEDEDLINPSQIKYSDFYSRFSAALIDTGLLILVIFVGMFQGVDPIAGILILFSVYITMENSEWQATIGKKVCGLIVTDLNGRKISLGQSILRNFAKLLLFILFDSAWGVPVALFIFISFIYLVFNKKQSLHDKFSRTLVIKLSGKTAKAEKQKNRISFFIFSIFLFLIICVILSIPKFMAEQNRMKQAIIENNMNKVKIITETFSQKNRGFYPLEHHELIADAVKNKYLEQLPNPFALKNEPVKDYQEYLNSPVKKDLAGMVLYTGDDCSPDKKNNKVKCKSYKIYGLDQNGDLLKVNDDVLFISNH